MIAVASVAKTGVAWVILWASVILLLASETRPASLFQESIKHQIASKGSVTLKDDMEMPAIMFSIAHNFINAVDLKAQIRAGAKGFSIMNHDGPQVREGVGPAVKWAEENGYGRIFTILYAMCPTNLDEMFASTGLDYVDLIVLHSTCTNKPEADYWTGAAYGPNSWGSFDGFYVEGKPAGADTTLDKYREFEAFVRSGKAKAIGVSDFVFQPGYDALKMLMREADIKPVFNTAPFAVGRAPTAELGYNEAHGVTMQAWSVFGRTSTDGGANHPAVNGQPSDLTLLDNPVLNSVAAAAGKTAAQVAIRFILQKGVTALVATSSTEHVTEALDVLGFELTNAQMAELSAINVPCGGLGLYQGGMPWSYGKMMTEFCKM